MIRSLAPHARKVSVRELSTGRVLDVDPVDAREYVGTGGWAYANRADAPAAGATPAAPSSFVDQLHAKSYKELQELAKKVGTNPNQKREALADLLVPHLEGGALVLEEVGFRAPPATAFPVVAEV